MFYRPVLEGVITLTELKTVATIYDILEINALLDMKLDMMQYEHEKMMAQNKQ